MLPSVNDILSPTGPLSAALGARFESRPQQLEMAGAVARALESQSHLLVEAGTGVGKSFAYLVPAILRCVHHNQRVVVTTHTIALQEQLIQKDIPLLQAALEDAGVIPRPVATRSTTPVAAPSKESPSTSGDRTLRAVLVKGRGNYVSIRRMRLASSRSAALFASDGARLQLRQIEDWAASTTDGTRSTLPRLDHPEVWSHVESDADNCMGAKCPNNAQCFYQNARRAMTRANLLVCNHALFFADLALRGRPGGVGFLPRYDHVVIDEAHAAEDVACEHLGMSLTEGRVQFLLRTLYDARRSKGYLAQLLHHPLSADGEGVSRAVRLVQDAWAASAQFFDDWRHLVESGKLGNGRVREPGLVENVLTPAMKELALRLDALKEASRHEVDRFELNAYARRAGELALGAEAFVNQSIPGCVYWVEGVAGEQPRPEWSGRPRRVALAAAPIDVAPLLKQLLFTNEHAVVLTSATLAAGNVLPSTHRPRVRATPEHAGQTVVALDETGGEYVGVTDPGAMPRTSGGPFALMMSRLGCEGAETLLLGSPFDYSRQMEVFVERGAPDPAHRSGAASPNSEADPPETLARGGGPSAGYAERVASLILVHIDATDGGAFVLFNAFSLLRRVAGLLADSLDKRSVPLLVHEPDAPRGELLSRFHEDPRSVLLGAASFWQGVDVPGRALRNVIIVQLPFEPPDRPLTEARLELVSSRGGDPFREDSLPRAVIRFKQGIGRLIRSKTDTGRVVILDPRVLSRGYGRAFLRALPDGARVRSA